MGWTFFDDYPELSRAEIMRRELSQTAEPDRAGFGFDEMAERGSVIYAIGWCDAPNKPRRYFGTVILTERRAGRFGYKAMDEDVHPLYYDIPARMLKKLETLAPDATGWAATWRAKCHEKRAAKRAAQTAGI